MYLDPGFGSMIIQMIIAAVAAGGAYALIFRNRIKGFFKRGKEQTEQEKEEIQRAEETIQASKEKIASAKDAKKE